nr:unnamed protein product [Callosobruchus analis]
MGQPSALFSALFKNCEKSYWRCCIREERNELQKSMKPIFGTLALMIITTSLRRSNDNTQFVLCGHTHMPESKTNQVTPAIANIYTMGLATANQAMWAKCGSGRNGNG